MYPPTHLAIGLAVGAFVFPHDPVPILVCGAAASTWSDLIYNIEAAVELGTKSLSKYLPIQPFTLRRPKWVHEFALAIHSVPLYAILLLPAWLLHQQLPHEWQPILFAFMLGWFAHLVPDVIAHKHDEKKGCPGASHTWPFDKWWPWFSFQPFARFFYCNREHVYRLEPEEKTTFELALMLLVAGWSMF